MERTIDDTMAYVLVLTRHVHKGDIPAAILAVLADLEFQVHLDGFIHLRKSIFFKTVAPDMHLAAIYLEIIRICNNEFGSTQIDQAIRNSIAGAWKDRNRGKWGYFFTEKNDVPRKPSNYEFIARIACFMELWCSWCKEEVSYAGK